VATLRAEMHQIEQRIVIRLGSMIVVATGIRILIAIKYFG
jgi:hypothetical protein